MQLAKMKEIISEAESAKVIAKTTDEVDVMTFQDVQKVNRAELAVEETEDLGERKVNPDGSYAASKVTRVAVDPDVFYENRYKRIVEETVIPPKKEGDEETVIKNVKYLVVTDYRAIKEQKTGMLYTNSVVAYVVEKVNKKLTITAQEHISEREFLNDFVGRLENSEMKKIMNSISSVKEQPNTDKFEF